VRTLCLFIQTKSVTRAAFSQVPVQALLPSVGSYKSGSSRWRNLRVPVPRQVWCVLVLLRAEVTLIDPLGVDGLLILQARIGLVRCCSSVATTAITISCTNPRWRILSVRTIWLDSLMRLQLCWNVDTSLHANNVFTEKSRGGIRVETAFAFEQPWRFFVQNCMIQPENQKRVWRLLHEQVLNGSATLLI